MNLDFYEIKIFENSYYKKTLVFCNILIIKLGLEVSFFLLMFPSFSNFQVELLINF